MSDFVDLLEKKYSTLLILFWLLGINVFLGQYHCLTSKNELLVEMKSIYTSLYVDAPWEKYIPIILLGVVILLILINKYGKRTTFFKVFSWLLSLIYLYYSLIWMIFFIIFGYSGRLYFIFPSLKISSTLWSNTNWSAISFLVINILASIIYAWYSKPTISANPVD